MQFSAFERTISGNTILFKNITPIENVQNITIFEDNSKGSFLKKEIRWSFNQIYWSAWQNLTPYSISKIDTRLNPHLYLEIRYVLSSVNSGTATSFSINYNEFAPSVIPSTEVTPSPSTEVTPLIDIIKKYDITEIYDTSLFQGYPAKYYLQRIHHIGQQPISSISGLQDALNTGVSYSYVDGSLNLRLKEASIGSGFKWNNGLLDVSASGDVTKIYVDGSLSTRDVSLHNLDIIKANRIDIDASFTNYYTKSQIDVSFWDIIEASTLFYTKTEIDANYYTKINIDSSFALSADVNSSLNLFALSADINSSLNLYTTNASVNLAFLTNASLAILTNRYNATETSLGQINASLNNTIDAIEIFYTKLEVDSSFALSADVNSSLNLYTTNASVNLAFLTNASIGNFQTCLTYIDACLGSTSILTRAIDACLGPTSILSYSLNSSISAYATNASVNNAFITNSSLGGLTIRINALDSSVSNIKALFIPNASLNQSKFKWSSGYLEPSIANSNGQVRNIGLVIDGGSNTITTGSKGFREIENNYNISGWTILANEIGSIVIDVKNSNYSTWPTTVSITGSEKPTLSSERKNQDTNLTTWVTSVSTGDILEFYVDSATTVKKIWLFLTLTPR